MKQKNYSSKVFAIMCFYVIAIIIRYYLTIGKPGFLLDISNSLFYNILTGIGPFIGSMVAIYILGRKTIYSSFGKSPIKSIACFTPIRDKIAISCMLRQIHESSSHAIRHGLYIKNRKRLFCP